MALKYSSSCARIYHDRLKKDCKGLEKVLGMSLFHFTAVIPFSLKIRFAWGRQHDSLGACTGIVRNLREPFFLNKYQVPYGMQGVRKIQNHLIPVNLRSKPDPFSILVFIAG